MPNYKESVIYQIYPRSFADSDGDGVGDLRGIISKLDYLADLGVDVLWLSPIFESPNADNGYDISDYEAIMPQFGTMADFDELLAGAHERGLNLILDLVVNHSSDEHRWFVESRKSKDNPYRDYYIWRKEINNWQSFFSGPAWKLDEQTGEYYLHLFAEKQPDLNWENPRLRQEIYQMMRFWLDKGVDGFRMDVIPFLSKDPDFPDYPEGRFGDLTIHANGPRIHEFLQEMHREVLTHYTTHDGNRIAGPPDRRTALITIGEGFGVSASQANLYVGENRHELGMIYHFDHAVPREEHRLIHPAPEFTLPQLKAIFSNWNAALETPEAEGDNQTGTGWQNVYFGNHDNPRVLSRFGDPDHFHYQSATALATVLLTLRGTPGIYQGDEIGMTNCPFTSIDEFDDIQVRNAWQVLVVPNPDLANTFLTTANRIARDHARTPMQWSNAPGAGFTTGKPWLKINPNASYVNVADQQAGNQSVLAYYKRLIHLRKQTPALHHGTYRDLLPNHPDLWVFSRAWNGAVYVTVANLSAEVIAFPEAISGTTVLGNYGDSASGPLQAWEARVIKTEHEFS
ncbi:alpha-glucosidase [Fibrella sp. HMF5335]|uniref:Alpha-glucosidase n=1 Tax=Fibrella rubiginis TaxID=2817060 RepID=A0A939GKJ8_9BACT|nr:alpha-glucosidase [Fibrella rubiginis]MBO0938118.1 alpha-glucosidase [Fibrella rubiginis]